MKHCCQKCIFRGSLKPAPFLGYLVGKVNPLAIFTWSTLLAFFNLLRQGTQGRILSQSGNNRYAQADDRLKKSGLGETSISNDPELTYSSAACRVAMGTYPASRPGGGVTIKAGSISASFPIVGGGM